MSGPIFVRLGVYIMAPEPISTAYFINPSHNSQVKDEKGKACSTNGEKRNAYGYWWGSQKERDH
jgi:hypothetical protein